MLLVSVSPYRLTGLSDKAPKSLTGKIDDTRLGPVTPQELSSLREGLAGVVSAPFNCTVKDCTLAYSGGTMHDAGDGGRGRTEEEGLLDCTYYLYSRVPNSLSVVIIIRVM